MDPQGIAILFYTIFILVNRVSLNNGFLEIIME